MADIQFETNPNEFGAPPREEGGWDLTGQIVSLGLAQTREQAEYVLIGVGLIALAIGAFFFFSGGGSSVPPPPPVA
jgi:hypothetical protein